MNLKKITALSLAGLTVMTSALTIDANEINEQRIAGKNRVETSIKTAALNDKENLILTDSKSFADTLSSFNVAISKNANIVLVDKNTDLSTIENFNKYKNIYIVGGNIDNKIIENAKKLGKKITIIAGKDRYETNEKTLEGFNKVGVADGRNYPDALSAAPLLKKEGLGLMLVNGSKSYNTKMEVKYTFGDKNSVKKDGGERLSGIDRYETNREINSKVYDNTVDTYTLVSGSNFADALSSINITLNSNNMVLLSDNINNDYFKNRSGKHYIVGGEYAVNLNKKENKSENKSSDLMINKKTEDLYEVTHSSNKEASAIENKNNMETTNLEATQLNKFLKGPCSNKGQLIIDLCNKYNQDPALMVALMGVETGFGSNIRHTNNPMSVLWNRGRGRSTYPTIEDGIEAGIRNIAKNKAYDRSNNFTSFARIYLGYSDANYNSMVNKFYGLITGGKSVYNARVR